MAIKFNLTINNAPLISINFANKGICSDQANLTARIVVYFRLVVRYTSVMFTQTQNCQQKLEKMKCFGVNFFVSFSIYIIIN